MKVGDLVTVRQDIREFVVERGDTAGLIISELQFPHNRPDRLKLFEILWPDSEIEKLYENEVESVNENRRLS